MTIGNDYIVTAKTLDEKIAHTKVLLGRYLREKEALANVESAQAGDTVSFKFGRADRVRVLHGSITALRDTSTGKFAAISCGEGFDMVTLRARLTDITHNETAKRRAKPT